MRGRVYNRFPEEVAPLSLTQILLEATTHVGEMITLPCNEFFTEDDAKDIAHAVRKVTDYYRRAA